jgi:hypothetical protein
VEESYFYKGYSKLKIKRLIAAITLLSIPLTVQADARPIPEGCQIMRCTCYTPTGNRTADGTIPFEGICASNREHLGQVAVVWTQDMEFVGYFECRDTGSHEGLVNGTRIDIFRETDEGVRDWQNTVGDWVIVQWVKGEG